MNILSAWLQKRKAKTEEVVRDYNQLLFRLAGAINEMNGLFINQQMFVDPLYYESRMVEWKSLSAGLNAAAIKNFKRAGVYHDLIQKMSVFSKCFREIPDRIDFHNNRVALSRVNTASQIIGDVEGRKLDYQQMLCVVKEFHNHLVIAGAGTGKTTTIVGRAKYLLKSGIYSPGDILVLSYTNASAVEMKERICKETGEDIEVSTFHKLGMNILKNAKGISPRITNLSLRKAIKEELNILLKDKTYLKLLSTYLLYNRALAKSEFDFKNQAEYNEYLAFNPPRTMNNELVKSYGEMDIANFLMCNGIAYGYEKSYEMDTRTPEFAQYSPDFYLTDYGVYIEYFGIDKNGNVPDYFTGKNGETARKTYNDSIIWKRNLHSKNGTVLIECFAYEKLHGDLINNLERQLECHNIELSPKAPDALWQEILAKENEIVEGIAELFETVIHLIKSNNYSFDTLKSINVQKGNNIKANSQLISLVEPLYYAYDKLLKQNDEVDFNDMINLSTQCVIDGMYRHSYKCVIVDEYQDMAKSRFMLLQAMRNSCDYQLFCVGDDWQSIYRFAGSDIGYILNFQKYWGPAVTSKIETTYRFSNKLIEISSKFIMQNPMQIRKAIRGNQETAGVPIGEINGYTEKYAVKFMLEKFMHFPLNRSVFLIGRYSFDNEILKENSDLTLEYNNTTGMTDVHFSKRRDLRIAFLTAHKSKGMQADYVVILNNKKSRMGFPSKVQDAPIFRLLLDDCDNYPYSEERRLFYVALTRAKTKSILLTVKDFESEFARELKWNFAAEIKSEAFECPLCGGKLLKKNGPYGEFMGCSNYKVNNCKYVRTLK